MSSAVNIRLHWIKANDKGKRKHCNYKEYSSQWGM